MGAGLQPPDLASDKVAPPWPDAFSHEALQHGLDFGAGRKRRCAHRRLGFANREGVIDRKAHGDVMNGIAGLKFAAEMVALCKGLCVHEPRLDLPQPIIAEVSSAFD
jgi:hypothetical protein